MLDQITKPRRRQNFVTYDLEWAKGEWQEDERGMYQRPKLRLVGVYDGKRYRAYRTVEAFLNGELTKRNRGKWFYAHAGGLADGVFLMEYLAHAPQYEVSASFSGSSAIIIRIKRGRSTWVFVDSYWLLRDKLANLAKFIGMEKGDVDFETESDLELLEYNKLDCVILHRAISEFQHNLSEIGGELGMTLASSAMTLFRRRYLSAPIHTSHAINSKVRGAYYASRVEVITKRCEGAFYYDLNSSFPHAMTFPHPGSLIRSSRKLDPSMLGDSAPEIVFADVEVDVPEMHFPPLPFRHEASVYFPVGRWRAWLSGVDIELLETMGGSVLKCHEALYFETRTDLRDYAEDLYGKRKRAKESGSAMEIIVYKLLLNSLYGKFGESREKTGLLLHPGETPHPEDEEMLGLEFLFPGAYLVTREVDVTHEHVPIAAWITSIARRTLYRRMVEAGDCYYCDTDGFATTNPDLDTGPDLGELKLETVIANGYFHRPKVYMMEDKEGRRKVKAKGFTLRPDRYETEGMTEAERKAWYEAKSVERFLGLLEGRPVEMRRFMRVRELFRNGEVIPTERIVKKQFRDNVREKRCAFADGVHTRPWHVEELAGLR